MKRLILLLLCAALILGGCRTGTPREGDLFYYPQSEESLSSGALASEVRDLTAIRSDLTAMAELYCAGPVTEGLDAPLPSGTVLESIVLEDGVLTMRFSQELAQLDGIELTVTAGALARTFLELTGAEELVITADGALLNGETALRLTLSQLSLRDDSLDRLHRDFTVYYASPDRRYLIGQEVSVHISSPEELPGQLLELLLTPPSGSGLRSALPEGTRFQSIAVENGLCTVDVSSEFENRRYYNMSAQCLSLLSVVNTLTGLEGIERVEFTVDGNLLIRYGSLFIDAPLERDERGVGPVRTGLGELDAILYLVHGPEKLLMPTPARVRRSTTVPLPELLVRSLLQDPGTNGIRSCIPEGTRLNGVTVTDETCFVDLSEQYLNDPANLRSAGRVIAATLCALDEVDRVQILVNGAVPAEFDEELFGILTPNEDWFL